LLPGLAEIFLGSFSRSNVVSANRHRDHLSIVGDRSDAIRVPALGIPGPRANGLILVQFGGPEDVLEGVAQLVVKL
jgi:hypothetical protein